MSLVSAPEEWKVRILGAAAGAVSTTLLGLLLYLAGFGLHVWTISLPAAALTGALFTHSVVRSPRPAGEVVVAALFACLVGIAAQTGILVLLMARGPWNGGIGAFAVLAVGFGAGALLIGFPLAVIVGAVATWLTRRLVRRADRVWKPAAAVVLAAVAVTGFLFVRLAFLPT